MAVGTRRAVALALIVAGLALAGLIVVAGWLVFGHDAGLRGAMAAVLAALAGCFALWYLHETLGVHFRALERLRGGVVTLAGDPSARLPLLREGDGGREVERLRDALSALTARHAEQQALPDRRLQAVLASNPDAIVVITDTGQVSLVNHAAKQLLGAGRVACGTSVYAALSRTTVLDAVRRAEAAGTPVDAMIGTLEEHQLTAKVASLGGHGGAVLTFPAEEVAFRAELDVDLALHDQPPPLTPFSAATPLEALPVLVLDSETTGLDIRKDRIVSLGAVRLLGGRIYRASSFDRLVDPGVPIPARSTAIHGITDAMVEAAAPFAEVFQDLRRLALGTVIVGHHVIFDLHMLRRECGLAGLDWPEPKSLDTLLLAAALEPDLPELSLDALAERLGVSIHGRHTALGDSLVTAEVFAHLLPRLKDRGVATLGEAQAYSRRARGILKAQEKAGW